MKKELVLRVPVIATLVVVVEAALLTVTGVLTFGQSGSQMIYAAVNQSDGTMRILAGPSATLRKNESLLTWNQAGPAGPQGIQGLQGPEGPPGPPGNSVTGGSVFRWNVFDTYDVIGYWVNANGVEFFGGINPSIWTAGNGTAGQISSDKEIQRALFSRKGYGGKNALVVSEVFLQYNTSNEARVAVCMFRIRNTTADSIIWTPYFKYTADDSWNQHASVALNGVDAIVLSGGAGTQAANIALSIPPNQISTIIFVSKSSRGWAPDQWMQRQTFLGFYNNSLELPQGLEYVDDLDSATGGYGQ